MASNKKQFVSIYQETVELLKNLKQNNDSINKQIGVEHDQTIASKIKSDENIHQKNVQKLEELLIKLQKSYIDPDTARKIGTIKQQYKIQKDRRANLLNSLAQSLLQNQHKAYTQNSQSYIKQTLHNISQNNNKRSHQSKDNNNSHINHTLSTTKQNMQKEQLIEYDYEIERKMLTEKNREIAEAEKTLLNIYNITKQTQQMTYYQGQELDIITDELIKANKNTVLAVHELKEANEQQKKSRSKLVKISILMILAAIAVIAICII